MAQYHIKFNKILDFLGQIFGPPYLYPHACYREKFDGFCNGAAPRLGNTKNEANLTSSYEVSKPSRHKHFTKIESLVHQLFLISYLFGTVYRILDPWMLKNEWIKLNKGRSFPSFQNFFITYHGCVKNRTFKS